MKALLGAHISAAGGHDRAFERARRVGADCLQIFTRAPSAWRGKPITGPDAARFRHARHQAGNPLVLAHDLYLTNLASPDPVVFGKSVNSLSQELERCHALGLEALVLHQGAHLGQGEQAGLERFASGLRAVMHGSPPMRLLLETTAGQGTCLGHRFEHLARIIELLGGNELLGVCLDTCHVWAAGYDLRSARGYERTWRSFARLLGMERLGALHLNDSLKPMGSRLDRHANIGQGALGRKTFARLVNDPRLEGIPMIIETPEKATGHAEDLALLRSLAQESA